MYEAPLYRGEGAERTAEIFAQLYEGAAEHEYPAYIWSDKACSVWYYIKNIASNMTTGNKFPSYF